ncbi:MAG: ParA family protein [Lachnospiraceae bacterium]|nr:ParA family protein [Lachnospiraceae bacterium]
MRTICIINRKGGVGKSTTASALAFGLAREKKKVLVIDLDAQRNLTYITVKENPQITSYNVILKENTITEAIIPTSERIDFVAASGMLSVADSSINDTGKEFRLREALDEVKDKYDYCLIDTPPSLGVLTVNSLTAADSCIIPVQAEIFSLQGTGDLYNSIIAVKKYCNPGLEISGILVTRCNSRILVTKELLTMLDDTAKRMNTKVYSTKIRECAAVKEAQATRENLFTYAPKCNAALDYNDFIEEFLKDEKKIAKKGRK